MQKLISYAGDCLWINATKTQSLFSPAENLSTYQHIHITNRNPLTCFMCSLYHTKPTLLLIDYRKCNRALGKNVRKLKSDLEETQPTRQLIDRDRIKSFI